MSAIDLSPSRLQSPGGAFALTGAEWAALDRYLREGLGLPSTRPRLLAIPVPPGVFMALYQAVMRQTGLSAVFDQTYAHCLGFWQAGKPQLAQFAAQVATYGSRAPATYGELEQLADQLGKAPTDAARARFRDLLAVLAGDAQEYAAVGARCSQLVRQFVDETTADQAALAPIHDQILRQYGSLEAWLRVFGAVMGNSEIPALAERTKQALDTLLADQSAAMLSMEHLEGGWTAIASDLAFLTTLVNQDLTRAIAVIQELRLKSAADAWVRIGQEAAAVAAGSGESQQGSPVVM